MKALKWVFLGGVIASAPVSLISCVDVKQQELIKNNEESLALLQNKLSLIKSKKLAEINLLIENKLESLKLKTKSNNFKDEAEYKSLINYVNNFQLIKNKFSKININDLYYTSLIGLLENKDASNIIHEAILKELMSLRDYFTTEDHLWYQIEQRLNFFIKNYKNNSKPKYISWGIDDENKFSIEPTKFISFTSKDKFEFSDENMLEWIKYYHSIKWIKFDPKDSIDAIKDENVIALNDYKKYTGANRERMLDALEIKDTIDYSKPTYQGITEQHYEAYSNDFPVSDFDIRLLDLFSLPNFYVNKYLSFKVLKTNAKNIDVLKPWMEQWKKILPKIISKNWTDEQKIKAVALFICTNAVYLYNSSLRQNTREEVNVNDNHIFSPVSIFENSKDLQCLSYSLNFAYALTLLNIPVNIETASLLELDSQVHAYNEVFLDNRWKVVDVTWADNLENFKWEQQNYEIDLNKLITERSDEINADKILLFNSYQAVLTHFKNPNEYEYPKINDEYNKLKHLFKK
ncbi:hypothetical protein [Mycoplasma hafezii]|uniref:hypothetical protein n=1 Tax=Mycoplasma hafezii TaxID=525886 RepID=UPI003CF5604A